MGHNGCVCTFTSYKAVKMLVPLPRRLLQSIQRFFQLAYYIFLFCSFEPHWLRHIDLLIKIALEKGGLHVELVKIQLVLCYQRQQNSNRQVFYNRGEYLVVVNAFSLCIDFRYQPDFIAYSITFERSLFLCIYPLTANCLLFLGQLCQFPSVVLV